MNSIMDLVTQELTGGNLSKLSQHVGADPSTTQQGLSAAIPLLVSGLARNASQPQGAQALHQTINQNHNGQVLDNVSGYLNNPGIDEGEQILSHVFGSQQGAVQQGVAQNTGLNVGQAGKLLAIVAPLVMGYLGRQQNQQGLDPSALAQMLGNQNQQAQSASPNIAGILGDVLGGNSGFNR